MQCYDKSIIQVVIIVPDNLIINAYDTRIHLLFSSITLLEPKYHLYLIGRKLEMVSLIALLYVHPFRLTELPNIVSLLLDHSITHVLRLDIGMFINNPEIIRVIRKDDSLAPLPEIPYHSILRSSDEALLRLPSQINADVEMHNKHHEEISKLTGGTYVKITCLLIVTGNVDGVDLIHTLEYYTQQTHINKELIIVSSIDIGEFIKEYLWKSQHCYVRVTGDDLATMFNRAATLSTGHYILSWNVGDWYHPTLLSICADRIRYTQYDYVTLPRIIQRSPDNSFTVSQWSILGWPTILMVRRDKYVPYTKDWLLEQWRACSTIYLLDDGSELLYVNSHYFKQKNDSYNLNEVDKRYYQAIFKRRDTPSSMTNIYRRIYSYMK